ncbi:lysis protein [Pseudomonas donghuensis]|uniref:Lysis protein n=1 Tax=Pseudomonas donghuensis TaxID=1163398 RepID=A0AAQ0DN01_9PSED|nr:lysis protein [Pseudomonas donghuensis]
MTLPRAVFTLNHSKASAGSPWLSTICSTCSLGIPVAIHSNAQATQASLRDHLATSDLRLSVLLAAPAQGSGCGVPATTGAGGVVHGAPRGELDPAAAQRIVAITDAGDQGLIALRACQAHVREIER